MKSSQLIIVAAIIFFVIFAVILLNFDESERQPDSSQEKPKPLGLQRVLDSCNSTGIQPSMGYRYSNGTHIITNNSCEWQTLEDYENRK